MRKDIREDFKSSQIIQTFVFQLGAVRAGNAWGLLVAWYELSFLSTSPSQHFTWGIARSKLGLGNVGLYN